MVCIILYPEQFVGALHIAHIKSVNLLQFEGHINNPILYEWIINILYQNELVDSLRILHFLYY